MSVPEELHALVERFDRDRDSYRSGSFNEAQTRVDFINPLLELLGWDVENREGRPEAYRDVVYEDRVKVGGGTKAPDYGFYAGGRRRFFFLRMAEDRGIEDYGRLMALLNGGDTCGRLCEIFRDADDRYNSGCSTFGTNAGATRSRTASPRQQDQDSGSLA
jgi:hypothetical protein